MSVVGDVRRSRSPKDALIVIAEAVDELTRRLDELERGNDWDAPLEWEDEPPEAAPPSELDIEEKHQRALEAMNNTDARDIVIPPPSEEKMAQRRMFAKQQLRLNQVLPPDEDGTDWDEVYVKGGPLWLYNADRGVVMQYDDAVRRRMVADVEEDDPKAAYQMALDVLKQPAGEPDLENGSGALAVGNVDGKTR